MKSIFLPILLLTTSLAIAQVHPLTFYNNEELMFVKQRLQKSPILNASFTQIKNEIDAVVNTDIDVPVPKDPAGGYTHDKHKENYMTMFHASVLYQLTNDKKYALLAKKMLLKYAQINPTLTKHPQATSSSPGLIFWQALNDANWLVFAGMSYDGISNALTKEEQEIIKKNTFAPIVKYLTVDLQDWFDRLHNHSVWACAGVGIVGIATDNKDYIDKAIYGTNKQGKVGFIQQMNTLFSPDGYYTEGPYYVRYAILPYIIFANAIQHYNPKLGIFNHRNQILKKALYTCLQQTNTDGVFFPLNDAIKEKDYTSNELVNAIAIAAQHYGITDELVYVAQKHNRVILHKGGALLSDKMVQTKIANFPYKTIESTDGEEGKNGGISIIRTGKGNALTSIIFKYASQGMGHGHFDRLNLNIFDKGNEIITDYGSARFIGIEQKYGGRYLKENTSYAAQTIAHNTIVINQQSHYNGNSDSGELKHPTKLFSTYSENVNAVAAVEKNAYPDKMLSRYIYTLNLPTMGDRQYIFDYFTVASNSSNLERYDFPFPFNGQIISTNYKYKQIKQPTVFGTNNGYQHLWKLSESNNLTGMVKFTFLNDKRFYSVSSLVPDSAKAHFLLTGANDPDFNLRKEQTHVLTTLTNRPHFFNVIEMHGTYDPVFEFSKNAYSNVADMELLQIEGYFIISAKIGKDKISIIQSINEFTINKKHEIKYNGETINWSGPFTILINNKNK